MIIEVNKEEFMKFAFDKEQATIENGKIFKVVQNGLLYILCGDFAEENLLSRYEPEIKVLGFVYNDRFYSTHYDTRHIDLNFYWELKCFEDKFNADYAEAIQCFTLENPAPITAETEINKRNDSDFEEYCKYHAEEEAIRELFETVCKYDKTYDSERFAPIFFDCLKNPEKYADYIQSAIEKNAQRINYKIKCNAEKDKALEALKTNEKVMYKLTMYKALKATNGVNVKMFCTLYGNPFELSIEREGLMRSLADRYDNDISLWNFTSSVRELIETTAKESGVDNAKILFTDIQKITYGRKTVFEKN